MPRLQARLPDELSVRAFFTCGVQYLLKWCPLKDDLLNNAKWIDFEHRLNSTFSSVEYCIYTYPDIFQDMNYMIH